MVYRQSVTISLLSGAGCHLVTDKLLRLVELPRKDGVLNLFVRSANVGISLNENADPTVRPDLFKAFELMTAACQHACQTAVMLFGTSLSLPVVRGQPDLGTWQGVYLYNPSGVRECDVVVTFIPNEKQVASTTVAAPHRGVHDILSDLQSVAAADRSAGLALFHLKHTSAAIATGPAGSYFEKAAEKLLNLIVPERWNREYFKHTYEGPDDMPGHVKSSLIGTDLLLPLQNGRLDLGNAVRPYLVEPRNSGGWGGGHCRTISCTFIRVNHLKNMEVKLTGSIADITPQLQGLLSSASSGLVHIYVDNGAAVSCVPTDVGPEMVQEMQYVVPAKWKEDIAVEIGLMRPWLLSSSMLIPYDHGELDLRDRTVSIYSEQPQPVTVNGVINRTRHYIPNS